MKHGWNAAIGAGAMRWAQAMVCLALAMPCASQQPVSAAASNAQPGTLQPNPMLALREFEGPAGEEYTLGPGDDISIDFAGHPELNVKRVVGPDGRITLSPAGAILIADKTREEAAQIIAASMSPFYTQPSVTVGVDKYTSNRVLLLGAVERPGPIAFDAPPTLLEVLTIGGGVQRGAQPTALTAPSTNVSQSRIAASLPERCAIYRGSDKVMWVDVKGLIDSGSALADLRLRRGDIVYVPSPSERYVSVLGQVNHPGALQLDAGSTLPKLLAEAGGLTALAGKNASIQVISPSTGKSRTIRFNAMLNPAPLDLQLKSGDVVYVTESGFNQAAYVLDKLSPLISIFTTAALLGSGQ